MADSSRLHLILGARVDKLTVRLWYDSLFRTALTAAEDWTVAPRLVFNDNPDVYWEATIDPVNAKRAIFMETASAVNEHFSGEKVELWEDDTIRASGQVTMYDRPSVV